jgi:hypothetical protein
VEKAATIFVAFLGVVAIGRCESIGDGYDNCIGVRTGRNMLIRRDLVLGGERLDRVVASPGNRVGAHRLTPVHRPLEV